MEQNEVKTEETTPDGSSPTEVMNKLGIFSRKMLRKYGLSSKIKSQIQEKKQKRAKAVKREQKIARKKHRIK